MNRHRLYSIVFLLLIAHGFAYPVITRNYTYTIRVKNVKLIRVLGPSTINLVLNTSVAGQSPLNSTVVKDNSSYLQMTSIVPLGVSRSITVGAKDGAIPTGTKLELTLKDCTATGLGDLGDLQTMPVKIEVGMNRTLISGIGSCFTGNLPLNGFNIEYSFGPDPDYSGTMLFNTNNVVTIVYTLTE